MRPKTLSRTICTLMFAAFIGVVVTAHFLGLSVYVITGASMTGAIPKGSIAVDRNVPVTALQAGDVITFQPPGSAGNVTHRIIEVQRDPNGHPVFKTKGDFNEAADPWQFSLNRPVQARYVFHIPWVGYILAAFTLRIVRTVVLAVVGLLILGVSLSWLLKTPARGRLDALQERMTLYRTGGVTLYRTGEPQQ